MLKKLFLIFSVLFIKLACAELCQECHFRYFINKSDESINVYSDDGQLKFIEGINIHPGSGFLYTSLANVQDATCVLVTNNKDETEEQHFYVKTTPEIEDKIKKSQLPQYYLVYDGDAITVWDKLNEGQRLNFEVSNACRDGAII